MKKSKRNKELQVFINALEKQEGLLLEFDEFLWETMIEHVTVSGAKEIFIKFKNGQIVRV